MAGLRRPIVWLLFAPLLAGCPDDGRKSGAAGVADAYEELAQFQCECAAEAYGGAIADDIEQACREMLEELQGEFNYPFECIDDAVSGNAQAKAAFDCIVDMTYDYVECVQGEGCPAVMMCPDGSTYTEFDVCDGFEDCEDGSDEANGCATEPFVCSDGTELSPSDVCDGFDDCSDAADEAQNCPETCDSIFEDAAERCGDVPESVEAQIEQCFPTFTCADGSTVDEGSQCDGFDDCPDGSDEASCSSSAPPIGPSLRRALRRG